MNLKQQLLRTAIAAFVIGSLWLSNTAQGAPFTVTVASGSDAPVAFPITLLKGDFTDFSVTLHAADISENGENEPLVVEERLGGAVIWTTTIGFYETTVPLHFQASADGVVFDAFIQDFDGDESATISGTVNRVQYSFTKKNVAARLSEALAVTEPWFSALDEALGGGGCVGNPYCKWLELVNGVGQGLTVLSYGLDRIASDPPDPNYTTIVTPVFPPVPAISSQLTDAELASYNGLMDAVTKSIGYSQAIYISLNRAQTAADAGDIASQNNQLQAVAGFEAQLTPLLNSTPNLLAAVQAALTAAGFPDIPLAPSDIQQAESDILANGLPAGWVDGLKALGLDQQGIDSIQATAVVQDISAASGHAPAKLTEPALITALQHAAAVFSGSSAAKRDFNDDGFTDYLLFKASTRQTAVWYLHGSTLLSGAYGPSLPAGWTSACAADVNLDGKPDYVLFNPSTRQTAIWYLNNATYTGGAFGPPLPAGWTLIAAADFNNDGQPDYVLFNRTTRQTAVWFLNTTTYTGGAFGPTLPVGWSLADVSDCNADGKPDFVLTNATTRQTAIWYLNGTTFSGGAFSVTLPPGWTLEGTADFNDDGKPDYLLFNPSTHQTAIWYLNNNVFVSGAFGPTLPAGYSLPGT